MNFKSLIIALIFSSFLFAMGESPLENDNIAKKSHINDPKLAVLIDGNLDTTTQLKNILITLPKEEYLKQIDIFQKEKPSSVKISMDIVNWTKLAEPIQTENGSFAYNLNGDDARYIKVDNSTTQECSEIAIYPLTDFTLKFESIDVESKTNSALVKIRTNLSTLSQVIYGYNYDFIYNKKLEFTVTSLAKRKEHTIKITNLKPLTTYRYQISVIDFSGHTLYSNFFTFTTKPEL